MDLVILSLGNFVDSLGDQVIIALISCIVCIVTGYIFVREKVLKNEIKMEQVNQYVDNHVKLLEQKINEMQQDIMDFKEINKETSRSLTENTAAIRELKLVLNLLKEQLNWKRRDRKNSLEDLDD